MRRRADVPVPGTKLTVTGLHALCVVRVRSGSRKWRDRWHNALVKLALDARCIEDMSDHGDAWETTWEVWGNPYALQRLTSGEFPVVIHDENAVAQARVIGPAGSGEKPKRTPMLPWDRFQN